MQFHRIECNQCESNYVHVYLTLVKEIAVVHVTPSNWIKIRILFLLLSVFVSKSNLRQKVFLYVLTAV